MEREIDSILFYEKLPSPFLALERCYSTTREQTFWYCYLWNLRKRRNWIDPKHAHWHSLVCQFNAGCNDVGQCHLFLSVSFQKFVSSDQTLFFEFNWQFFDHFLVCQLRCPRPYCGSYGFVCCTWCSFGQKGTQHAFFYLPCPTQYYPVVHRVVLASSFTLVSKWSSMAIGSF